MRKLVVALAYLGCLVFLAGCKEEDVEYGAPMTVRLLGVRGAADLEPGMKTGLWIGEPVGVENITATVTGQRYAVPDRDLRWAFDQNRSSRFFAYAPYDASYSGQDFVAFETPADQSTVDKMKQGNLLIGESSGSPMENAVNITLEHAMSSMAISFDNRTGSRIDSVIVSGFITDGVLDFVSGKLVPGKNKSHIRPFRSPLDDNTFSFIYIPQDVTPYFMVYLSNGKKIGMTFVASCQKSPGKIFLMRIQLNESTPDVNILDNDSFLAYNWTSSNLPPLFESPAYINLSDLKDVTPDIKQNGFFYVYLNKITVTAVDNTNDDCQGIILEDSTCAVHVWADNSTKFRAGYTVTGPVHGLMEKNSDGVYINRFYVRYATVDSTDILPLTRGRFDALDDSIGLLEYRRMVFDDIILKEPFRNERAVFLQDGVEMSVVCPGIEMKLAAGVKGKLTGFPVRSGTDIFIMVYDADSIHLSKEYDDIPLSPKEEYGLYDLTSDDAHNIFSGENRQYSVRFLGSGMLYMQVADFTNGMAATILVYTTGKPEQGHIYTVAYNTYGDTERQGRTLSMECVKVSDNKAWFVNNSSGLGLIMAL